MADRALLAGYPWYMDSFNYLCLFFRIASVGLGQLYSCPRATGVTLNDMDKLIHYLVAIEHTWVQTVCTCVRSRNCGCVVTWFCYQLIAKPGNKTAAVPWPDTYFFECTLWNETNFIITSLKERADMMLNLSSLAAIELVIATAYSATNDDKVAIMKTLDFQCSSILFKWLTLESYIIMNGWIDYFYICFPGECHINRPGRKWSTTEGGCPA